MGESTGNTLSDRLLRSVLFADLAEYTLHVSQREDEVLSFMRAAFQTFKQLCNEQGGEFVKTTGDGVVVVFKRPAPCLIFALKAKEAITQIQGRDPKFKFRMGMNFGELQWDGGDVYGHAVNVAARLEALAPEGEIYVSQDVVALAGREESISFQSVGLRKLKNIPHPIVVYRARPARIVPHRAPEKNLSIEVMNGPRMKMLGKLIALPNSKTAQALLGILALSTGRTASIGHLAALLRPTTDPKSARRTIVRAAKSIQDKVGLALRIDQSTISLDELLVDIDIEDIETRIWQMQITPLLTQHANWSDSLLQGVTDMGPNFESWLAVARVEWRERVGTALEAALEQSSDLQSGAVRDIASALLRIEAGHERAARALISYYVARDDRVVAIKVFEELRKTLSQRYGLQPRPETLRALDGVHAPSSELQISSEPLRLQVRDFEATDEQSRPKLASLRSELLAGLSCFRSWAVVEGEQDTRESSAPDYVIDALQVSVGRLILSLTDAQSGELVRSDTFETDLAEANRSTRLAVGRIAAALEVYISTDRFERIGLDTKHAVVDAWLRADRLALHWTPKSHDAAAAAFEKLTKHAPDFAPGHASLAGILNVRHVVRPGSERDAEVAKKAHMLASEAVRLDPLDARNQLHLAWSAALDGAFDISSIHMDLAARLNPHSPRTLMSCAMGFSFLGEHERALELVEHSIACAPRLMDFQWGYAASVHFFADQVEEAAEALDKAGTSIVDLQGWHAVALARQGRISEAAAAFSQMIREVTRAWDGEDEPTPAQVRDWFVKSYPLRRKEERDALRDALSAAIQGINMPV